MATSFPILEFRDQHLELLPQRAVYWHEEGMLIIADAHLGKVGHFRKAGIPVPAQAGIDSAARLYELTVGYRPKTVLFLGDLFHSSLNKEWQIFMAWRKQFPEMQVILVQGNHDILPVEYYTTAGMQLALETYIRPPFIFSHEPQGIPHHRFYTLAGHIHPAVRLSGRGRQSFTLSCFLFGSHQGLLPAFGTFTGTAVVRPLTTDMVYVVSNGEVVKLEA